MGNIFLNVFQIRDLSERIEILRVKRMQDKDKMKDFEKIRLQLEQLIEFKTKVMESQVLIPCIHPRLKMKELYTFVMNLIEINRIYRLAYSENCKGPDKKLEMLTRPASNTKMKWQICRKLWKWLH